MHNPWWFYWPGIQDWYDSYQAGDATSEHCRHKDTNFCRAENSSGNHAEKSENTQWFQTLQVNSLSGCNCSPEVLLAKEEQARVWLLLIACLNKGLESRAAVSCKGWKETGRKHGCYVNHPFSVSVNISCLYCSWSENNHPCPMKCSLVAGVAVGMGFLKAFQLSGIPGSWHPPSSRMTE